MDAQQQRLSIAAHEGAMVTVILKFQNREYKVHQALLIEESEYFREALTGPWRGTEDRYILLEDVERSTFDIFIAWLYANRLPDVVTGDTKESREWETSAVKSYAFGDRFKAAGFKGAVHQTLLGYFVSPGYGGVPLFETITLAFTRLPEDDPLLRLLVDVQCHKYEPDNDVGRELEDRKHLPYDFLLRVMMRYSKICICSPRQELDVNDYQLGTRTEGNETVEE